MVDISVEIAGIKFRNPVLTAAGPPSRNGQVLVEAARGGAGGLVAKTISVEAAKVPRPNMALIDRGELLSFMLLTLHSRLVSVSRSMVKIPRGMLNTELWSDIPYQQWLEKEYKIAKGAGLPVIASVGYTADELRKLGPEVEKAGVDGIEFSTHYIEYDPKPLVEVAKALRESVEIPIFVKLSPHVVNIEMFAKAVEKYVDGVVAINSLGPCLYIDVETGKPLLGGKNGYGWLSGPAIKPLAVRCVADIARTVKKPVIGVGGVMSGRDAIEFFMVGASAVQICTGAILEGPKIYGQVAKEIQEFLKNHGYDSIEDIKGIALKYLPEKPLRTHPKPPKLYEELCKGCGLCVTSCVYGALKLVEDAKSGKLIVSIDEKKCDGCGLCTSICPTRALKFE
jgi:dihydroorotate dehydrogenase subfamily 1